MHKYSLPFFIREFIHFMLSKFHVRVESDAEEWNKIHWNLNFYKCFAGPVNFKSKRSEKRGGKYVNAS